ncbi:DinB family protein [Poritiphilus flavus]|uniref:DinB family protein n=1 Tax=Poritiphilus flavus TaxID=2697053 RepID=A0A6L9ED35_9FLAO|nr:DinB family protein [Poritiphilus flavus]NAS12552.1 DinB family protein [Poritiphilus flavus]
MNTDKLLDISSKNQEIFRAILLKTPREKLLQVPKGFRNNIWWNIAHAMVTQQLLIYVRSRQEPFIPRELIEKYRKGTVPDGRISDAEVEQLISLLKTTAPKILEDYRNGIFTTYEEFTTSSQVVVSSVEDAIAFNAFHEGLHLGAVLSLQKTLG